MVEWLLDLWREFFGFDDPHPLDSDEEDPEEPEEALEEPSVDDEAGTPSEVEDTPTEPLDEPVLPPPPVLGGQSPHIVVEPPRKPPAVGHDGRPVPAPKEFSPFRRGEEKETMRFDTIGMWVGNATLASKNYKDHVKFAVDHGINRFDLVVNDHSKARGPREFDIRDRDRIMRVVDECHKKDVQVALLSWIMPHEKYLRQMGEILVPLAKQIECVDCGLDAEEPWMLAQGGLSYAEAGALAGEVLSELHCPVSVTGIAYASVRKMKPLMDEAAIARVQSYPTRSSKRDPVTSAAKDFKRYTKYFAKDRPAGAPPLQVEVALPCYRQTNMKVRRGNKLVPISAEASLRTAATAALKLRQRQVVYWWLPALMANKTVARTIASFRDLEVQVDPIRLS